jgi:hypothetical protein
MLKRLWIPVAVIVPIVLFLALSKVYVVRSGASGTLYWNEDKALLFVQVGTSGVRLSSARYALEPFLVSLGDVRPPDDHRCVETFVLQITDKGFQRYETTGYCYDYYVLSKNQIYTGLLGVRQLYRWDGTRFEPATQEELRGFDPLAIAARGLQFDNVEGWSMREQGLALGHVTYPLTLNHQQVTYISTGRRDSYSPLTVDIKFQTSPPQRIWSFEGGPHPISKAEYESIFNNH